MSQGIQGAARRYVARKIRGMVLRFYQLESGGFLPSLRAYNLTMGLTYVIAKVRGKPGNERRVRLLVDSGATYSLLPERTWKALKLRPMREVTFSLADGTPIRRKVSECFFVLPQGQGTSPVVLGETGDAALLGVVTLESLGLVLNPFDRTLQDMKAMLV